MKAKHTIKHEGVKKITTIGNSTRSRRKHGRKNRQKKFSVDYRGQGR